MVATSTVVCSYVRRDAISKEEQLQVVSDGGTGMISSVLLTDEATINQSSTPNAFTIFTRTMHRSKLAIIAVAMKVMFTAMSSGPRLGIAMMYGGGSRSHGPLRREGPQSQTCLPKGSCLFYILTEVDLDRGSLRLAT